MTTFSGLASGGVSLSPDDSPAGYTLLLDLKPMSDEIAEGAAWALTLISSAEVVAAEVPHQPATLSDLYPPNEQYKLCRLIVGTAGQKCSAALHVSVSEPTAIIECRAIALTTGGEGGEAVETGLPRHRRGCVTLMAVVSPPPPPRGRSLRRG